MYTTLAKQNELKRKDKYKLIKETKINIVAREGSSEREIQHGLECSASINCTNLQISYSPAGGLGSSSNLSKVPFGIGWRSHFNFCFARLLEGSDKLLRRRDFAVIDFTKKEVAKLCADWEAPVSCMLTQYHVIFAYTSNITVVSLIN